MAFAVLITTGASMTTGTAATQVCTIVSTWKPWKRHGRRRETLPPTRANKRRNPRLFEQNNAVEWETGIILFFRNVYILVCIVKRRESDNSGLHEKRH